MQNRKRANLEKYEADPRVESACDEGEDGYWIALKTGWHIPESQTHAVHERTAKRLADVFKTVAPCKCPDCRRVN
jgi:hypothetical protein